VNTSSGQAFTGPGGPTLEYANITSDSLNVTSNTSSAFIITGSGNDVINASGSDGYTVLDGGTGSDLLLGGKGNDTFLTTVLGQTKDTLTTAAYLHSGDDVTILGVTLADFNVDLSNNAGLPGYTGLQYAFSGSGQPTTKVVLSGYSTADLLNGKLSQSFGTVNDTPYLNIHVT
jgi:Ca2+-binding RTX toxin-like protein